MAPGRNEAVVTALFFTALVLIMTGQPAKASCVSDCDEGCEVDCKTIYDCQICALLTGACASECPVDAPTCLSRCGLVAGSCHAVCLDEGNAACLDRCSAQHKACLIDCGLLLPSPKIMSM